MLIWNGYGLIVPVMVFLAALVTQIITNVIFNDSKFYTEHGFPKFIAMAIAGVLLWLIGAALNRQNDRVLIDKKTGEEVILRKSHSFFFIPVKYWSFILFGVGVYLLFK